MSSLPFRGVRVSFNPSVRRQFEKYITGIVSERNQKLIAINCMPDHTHILLGLKPDEAPSDLTRAHQNRLDQSHQRAAMGSVAVFRARKGFGAFSISHSHLGTVIDYIHNQENHHRRKSFQQEYVEFLERHDVAYNPLCIFKLDE